MVTTMRKFLFYSICFLALVFLQNCNKEAGDYSSSSSYDKAGSGFGSSSSSGGTGQDTTKKKAGVITAAEWNDLKNWSFWQGLRPYLDSTQYGALWGFNVAEHTTLILTDMSGKSVIDATIVVKNGNNKVWEAKTDNKGRAEFFVSLFGGQAAQLTISAQYDGVLYDLGAYMPMSDGLLNKQIAVPTARQTPQNLDVMFVVDATGSMGDELEYLKIELSDVISRIHSQNAALNLKIGSVFYRDKGDEYLTRTLPFTNNAIELTQFVQNQKAGGGGDTPEAVEVACEEALRQNWRPQALARVMFLLLDAPPHSDQSDIKVRLEKITRQAAQNGIKIVPIFASSSAKEAEFLMRFMAMATNGTYIFITDDSGIGNTHIKPTVGKYQIEYLNDLLVRLMKEYTTL